MIRKSKMGKKVERDRSSHTILKAHPVVDCTSQSRHN